MSDDEPGSGKMLGVLGGMGPLASAQFMLRLTLLTPADARPGPHPRRALVGPARAGPQRGAARHRAGPAALAACTGSTAWQRPAAARSRSRATRRMAGSTACEAASPMPILHIIDAAAADLRRQGIGPGRIGVMGTAATLAMRLYQDRLGDMGWPCIEPRRRRRWPRLRQPGDRGGEGEPRGGRLRAAGRNRPLAARPRRPSRSCSAAPRSRSGSRPALGRTSACRSSTRSTPWPAPQSAGRIAKQLPPPGRGRGEGLRGLDDHPQSQPARRAGHRPARRDGRSTPRPAGAPRSATPPDGGCGIASCRRGTRPDRPCRGTRNSRYAVTTARSQRRAMVLTSRTTANL